MRSDHNPLDTVHQAIKCSERIGAEWNRNLQTFSNRHPNNVVPSRRKYMLVARGICGQKVSFNFPPSHQCSFSVTIQWTQNVTRLKRSSANETWFTLSAQVSSLEGWKLKLKLTMHFHLERAKVCLCWSAETFDMRKRREKYDGGNKLKSTTTKKSKAKLKGLNEKGKGKECNFMKTISLRLLHSSFE